MELTRHEDGSFGFFGRAYDITKTKNELLAPYNKIVHNWGVVLTLRPNEDQKSLLNQQIGNARFMRNRYLADRIDYYEKTKKALFPSEYKKAYFPKLKEEFPFLKESDKFALEAAVEHVDTAFKKFYNKETKFPRFASKWKPSGNKYTTKFSNNNIEIVVRGKEAFLKLPKVKEIPLLLPAGKTIKDIVPDGARILSCSIKKDSIGYTASLQLETVIDKPVFPQTLNVRDILSADMGIKHFAMITGKDGSEPIKNPHWIKVHEKRTRRLQKSLSRKKYDTKTHTGSKNWEKAKARLAREHRKCKNQRKDFHHKLSRAIVDSCSAFVCEDLNIKGMLKNHRLSKAISSVGWGTFLTMVKYKMQRAGKYFIKADRWFASSQTCSHCGYKNPEVKDLKVRQWTCPKCETHHDRDENAGRMLMTYLTEQLSQMGVSVTP